jgi:hypothetical protein
MLLSPAETDRLQKGSAQWAPRSESEHTGLRRVLIVSPNFVPVNSPDMQRVRMSLAHFRDFGWEPVVLAVDPEFVEGVIDPVLEHTHPQDIPIFRVRALPTRLTRKIGLGSLGLRAFPFLYREGRRLIRQFKIDLTYFSTTMFPAMAMGRLWKLEFGVPFLLDMQDPWVSDYHESRDKGQLPPKFRAMNLVHRVLEPWTMKEADGLIAVSAGYIETLNRRYPRLAAKPSAVLPFGAAENDFEALRAHPQQNRFFRRDPADLIHGVYAGCAGPAMAPALRVIFTAFRRGLQENPELFSRVQMHFIGTDYAPDHRSKESVAPVAAECGVSEYVHEWTHRIPYFEALQLLVDSDFLLVPGLDDPQYTASKICPYILARKPLLCVFQESSNVCGTLEILGAGTLLKFKPEVHASSFAAELCGLWAELLSRLPFVPDTDWGAFSQFGAREGTRKQCLVFDQICEGTASGARETIHARSGLDL